MRKVLLPLLLLGVLCQISAQQVKDVMKEPIPVAMFQVTYALELPGLDTRDIYGLSHNLGGSFIYKTTSNWMFTANANFLFGNKVKGDRISIYGEGITTVDGEIVGGSGSMTQLAVDQRGLFIQAEVGKLFPFRPNPNSGFFVQAGIGYLRSRIRTDFQETMLNTPYVVEGDYQYGYDRMRGGPAFHLEAGYLYLGDTSLLNFSVALEVTYARTRDLRDYDFRVFTNPETGVMEPVGTTNPKDPNYNSQYHKPHYNDFYYGIRISWNIPTYQRQPENYYYN